MRHFYRVALLTMIFLTARWAHSLPGHPPERAAGYPITPVPFTAVRVDDRFWSPRLETNRSVTIPHVFRECEETGRIRNFQIADSILEGQISSGTFCTRYGFDDSDVFKAIEAAAYALHTQYDERLDRYLDALIVKIAGAQEKDGYLYTMRTINPEKSWAKERWINDRMKSSHELYNVGHLYEAAVAHFAATGKRSLLEIALRSADLLVRTFGPEKMHTAPGHQVTEIGLAKLYIVTGERKYLDLAKFFIDERGRGTPPGETYNQDRIPVAEQTEAEGHAVRAAYFYAGIADVAALLGDESMVRVIDRIWEDVVTKKLYVTGGIGSAGDIEGFGPPYELPNLTAYCETCASIANVFWNFRMFLRHGDARYVDVLERVIYNGVLPGVSLQGDRFFYPNPLASIAGRDRTPWFTCACCPPNVARFIPSIPGYVYARRNDSVYVNLFIGGQASMPVNGVAVELSQSGGYPWESDVTIRVSPARPIRLVLKVRVPGWAREEPIPGDLYRYVGVSPGRCRITVNGKETSVVLDRGYALIGRTWTAGDRVDVRFPMVTRRVAAHPKIEADRGRVALQRGPVMYCLEGVDQPGGWVFNLLLSDTAAIREEFRSDLLGGVEVLRGRAASFRRASGDSGRVAGVQEFTAIPYYAWAHRGRGQMTVWPAREERAVYPRPQPTLASASTVTVSAGTAKEAVNDQFEPGSSSDHAFPYLHWWPRKGTTEWVQYEFPRSVSVSAVEVYWYDDTGTGECRIPKSWRVMYRDGGGWKPVSLQPSSPATKDRFNVLIFAPVATDAVRLEITSQDGFAAGIHEWKVR